MFNALDTSTWSCPLRPLHSLVGEWRLFFDTGAIRTLLVRMVAAGITAEVLTISGTEVLRQIPIHQSIRGGIYTETIEALQIPVVLGHEYADEENPPVHEYRIRARFCNHTAVLEAFDLSGGLKKENFRWYQRTAIAIRDASPLDVPLVVPGQLMWAAYEVLSFTRAWSAMEVAARLSRPRDNDRVEFLTTGWDEERHIHRLERFPWRQQMIQVGRSSHQDVGLDNVLLSAAPQSIEAWEAAWNHTPSGGLLMGNCAITEAELAGPILGHLLGQARFGPDGCIWMLHKSRMQPPPIPGPPFLHGLGNRGIVLSVFKPRGEAGVGIRLGNVLFNVAASIALAVDYGFALRLTISALWQDYFTGDAGIFSQMPTSFWYTRTTHVDLLYGTPDPTEYTPPPPLTPKIRSVIVHGYFQNPRYFSHHMTLVRRLLMPPEARQAARAAWNEFRRKARFEDAGGSLIAVHVRLGDQKSKALGVPFYRAAVGKALRMMKPRGSNPLCVLFSDDTAALQGALADSICERNVVFDVGPLRDDLAMLVMAQCCSGIVISASTFSWWAAVLGAYRAVVAPRTHIQECRGDEANFTLGAMPGWSRMSVPCVRPKSLYSQLRMRA